MPQALQKLYPGAQNNASILILKLEYACAFNQSDDRNQMTIRWLIQINL